VGGKVVAPTVLEQISLSDYAGIADFSIWAAYSVDAGISPPRDLKNNPCRSEQHMKI
jgi:hypothetical protein